MNTSKHLSLLLLSATSRLIGEGCRTFKGIHTKEPTLAVKAQRISNSSLAMPSSGERNAGWVLK